MSRSSLSSAVVHVLASLAVVAIAGACATTGAEGEGDKNLPTAGVGPFRKLDAEEVKGLAPYVLDDSIALYREPAVLRDVATSSTVMYAVARVSSRDVIVRSRALDERTFFGTSSQFGKKPLVVLEPTERWEGPNLDGPAVFRRSEGEPLLLFYSAAEGIGLARSTDGGLTFTKDLASPVLRRDFATDTWETEPPHSPTIYALGDGRLRMFYAAGAAIGEAESTDGGATWKRLPLNPVLVPAPPAAPGSLLPNEKPPFDTLSVGDPCAVTRVTPAGRFHVRVVYTGKNEAGSAIGFAARYGDSGPLDRQPVPVYAVGLHEAAPALLDLGATSYLYAQQDRRDGNNPIYTAIAAAFSPGNVKLPPAGDFPDTP